MLKGLFPRLFCNFREGGIVHAKFVVSAGPVYTLKTNVGNANYLMTAVAGGTGVITLTLVGAGGVRNLTVLNASHINIATPGTPASFLKIFTTLITLSTGVTTFLCQNSAATEVAANPVATDEIHFTLLVDK